MTIVKTSSLLGPSEIGLIKGIEPDSNEELRTAVALYTYKWDFEFQVPIGGGYSKKGGTVVDFLVKTAPSLTALFVDGHYWHKGDQRSRDIFARINLKKILGARLGIEPEVIELYASDLYDQDAANAAVLEAIGRA